MKVFGLIALTILLSGCGSDNVKEYLRNKIVYDTQGCAFWIKASFGDNVFPFFSKELSKPECKFELEE